jgi:acid phosphatase family membrane protein YuiD
MEAKMIINPKKGIQIPFKLVVIMASKGARKGSGTKAHIKSMTPKIKKQKGGFEQSQMLQL